MIKNLFLLLAVVFLSVSVRAQNHYPSNSEVASRVQKLAAHKNVTFTSLAKTAGGNDVWALKIGTGDVDNKPAIAVVGGVEGCRLVSVELALQFAERLVSEHADALDSVTFFVFPNMSPDASAQYFAPLKYERIGNSVSKDQDRDGAVSEDPYEDLNKDGFISLMRVKSPVGDYKTDPSDDRLVAKADREKGERGQWLVYSEGIDNDHDGTFNEDLEEGIAFNKNFTYQFQAFKPFADDYAVSQKEDRALIDYLFQQWNIFAFVTFGPENNLSAPLKYNEKNAKQRIITSMLKKDVAINETISELYNKTVSEKPYRQDNQGAGGDFFQWAYFHFGRLSFSTPGWWVPEMKIEEEGEAKKDKENVKLSEETNFLRWAEQQQLDDVFIPWAKVDHPDFPNQTVEVGGIKPFVMINPPFSAVDSIAEQHTNFILKLAAMHPQLEFHNLKVEKLDGGLSRITTDLYNNSPLPTHSEMGEKSRWLRKIRVDISLDKKEVVAGNTINLIDKLDAFGTRSLSWIVRGNGNVEIKAGAAHTGFATLHINL